MAEYIERDMLLKMISHKPSSPTTEREDRLINGFISAVKNCPAADVLPRDEAIRMGAELAAMHGSDATSQQLEEAYLEGVEYGMTRRDVRPVVRGTWIEHYEPYSTGEEMLEEQFGYECSICGRWEYEKEPFCNCGADMREKNNGD